MPAARTDIAGATRRFTAMGSTAEVLVTAADERRADLLADRAQRRIATLERRWSRFLPGSEISRCNRAGGAATAVSTETVRLVRTAIEAWRRTGGVVDPTVLGAVIRAGYDRPFAAVAAAPRPGWSALRQGCAEIEVGEGWVRLPADVGFDPGGIGKGLGADLVVHDLLQAGALGACVNLGGDLRAEGVGPEGDGWTIAVVAPAGAIRTGEPPAAGAAEPGETTVAVVGLHHGAVATSTTLRRTWVVAGERRHHLVDPATGRPAATDLLQATVVAPTGWEAEALAKAVLLRGSDAAFELVGGPTGAEALTIDRAGIRRHSPGFARFEGVPA